MENQQEKIFANSSQTHFALRNPIPHYTVALRNLPLTKPMRNFALPKFAMSSQTNFAMRKFRNAKFAMRKFRNANFAMPNSISQCQSQFRNAKANFAMPNSNSQCQFQFRNANTLFICLNLCEISHCEIHNPLCEFRKPISHCQIHCLCEIHNCKPCHPL